MRNIFIYLIIFTSCITSCTKKIDPPANLQCEYLDNPLGIDTSSPRLTWRIAQAEKVQTAYQIMVSTDSIELANNKADMWDTKKTDADNCLIS